MKPTVWRKSAPGGLLLGTARFYNIGLRVLEESIGIFLLQLRQIEMEVEDPEKNQISSFQNSL